MAKMIELHWNGNPFSVNVNFIAGVVQFEGKCEIYMVGDVRGENWNAEEPYEEVMRIIKEASNG